MLGEAGGSVVLIIERLQFGRRSFYLVTMVGCHGSFYPQRCFDKRGGCVLLTFGLLLSGTPPGTDFPGWRLCSLPPLLLGGAGGSVVLVTGGRPARQGATLPRYDDRLAGALAMTDWSSLLPQTKERPAGPSYGWK